MVFTDAHLLTVGDDGYENFAHGTGNEVLEIDVELPMVDQPQPIDETTIEGAVSFYADGKTQDGTIVAGTDKYGYTVRSVNGKVYDEVKRGDIEPRLADEMDDLPFSDLGVDDEDTKELPAITMQHTPCNPTRPTIGDAIKLPLSNLIDAALMSSKPTERIDALNALRTYEWSTVPSWVMEIELSDLLQAFDSAMVERRNAKVKVLYGIEVTPQDIKALIRTRAFCNLVSDCMTIVSQVYQARVNHFVKVDF
jgi:hypothetical protein